MGCLKSATGLHIYNTIPDSDRGNNFGQKFICNYYEIVKKGYMAPFIYNTIPYSVRGMNLGQKEICNWCKGYIISHTGPKNIAFYTINKSIDIKI